MNLFKVNHSPKAFFNTLLERYDTCRGQQIFTFQLPGKCEMDRQTLGLVELRLCS